MILFNVEIFTGSYWKLERIFHNESEANKYADQLFATGNYDEIRVVKRTDVWAS